MRRSPSVDAAALPLAHLPYLTVVSDLRPDATSSLTALLRDRLLVIDGAMGTLIQGKGFGEADFRGERFADWPSDLKGNNDLLSLTQPDAIEEIHRAYFGAGADIATTNTFNAQRISLADYGMHDLAYELNPVGPVRGGCDGQAQGIPHRSECGGSAH